jgi:hypothetical protein
MGEWHPDVQTASVLATISINIAVGGAFLLLFELLRSNTDIFAPKKYWAEVDKKESATPEVGNSRPNSTAFLASERFAFPARGLLAWIPQVLSVEVEVILSSMGLDAYVMLRFLRLCFKVGCATSLLGLGVLVPTYYTAPTNTKAVGINLYSMSHVHQMGDRLWASVGAQYAFTLIFCYYMHKEYENFAIKRKLYFKSSSSMGDKMPLQSKYSVRVENIPAQYRTNNALKRFFDSIFPNEVFSAQVVVDVPELDAAIASRNAARNNLETSIAAMHASKDGKTRPVLWLVQGLPVMCYGDTKVDAIEYWYEELYTYNDKVAFLQDQTIKASNGMTADSSSPLLFQALSAIKNIHGASTKLIKSAADKAAEAAAKAKDAAAGKLSGKDMSSNSSSLTNSQQQEEQLQQVVANSTANEYMIPADKVSGSGFVTFKNRRTQVPMSVFLIQGRFIHLHFSFSQVIACQVPILSESHPEIRVFPAAAPSDIIWENMSADINFTEHVQIFTTAALSWGFVFWGAILSFVAAMSTLENLESLIPALDNLDEATKAVLSGQLPVIVLIVFVSLLPVILTYVMRNIEKRKTESEVQDGVFRWLVMAAIYEVR